MKLPQEGRRAAATQSPSDRSEMKSVKRGRALGVWGRALVRVWGRVLVGVWGRALVGLGQSPGGSGAEPWRVWGRALVRVQEAVLLKHSPAKNLTVSSMNIKFFYT